MRIDGTIPDKLPGDTVSLIRILDAAFPAKCIAPDDSYKDALFYGGKRALIDVLKIRLEAEEKD